MTLLVLLIFNVPAAVNNV